MTKHSNCLTQGSNPMILEWGTLGLNQRCRLSLVFFFMNSSSLFMHHLVTVILLSIWQLEHTFCSIRKAFLPDVLHSVVRL